MYSSLKKLKKLGLALLLVATLFNAFLFFSCNSTKTSIEAADNTANFELITDPELKIGTLSNGMTYFIKENSTPKNRISLRLVVKAGSAMEEENQKGVAHFIEHLAFNGTENFAKSEIVDFFESVGMNFGSGLNAFTNFLETVYQIEIPADDPEILKKAIMIMHDWASSIAFEQEEIDKERGVIIEEDRTTNQGLQARYMNYIVDLYLDDSQLEKRLPIGDMEVIKNVTRDEILDFYKKWYRPEFMSVVAVGDIQTEVLEEAIISTMETIPEPDKSVEIPTYAVPFPEEKSLGILKDPEQAYSQINIAFRNRVEDPIKTVADLKESLKFQMGMQILSQRLQEITNFPDAPWLYSTLSTSVFSRTTKFYEIVAVAKENQFVPTFCRLLDEYDRALIFGFTNSELSIVKEMFISSYSQTLANKDTLDSYSLTNDIVNHLFSDDTVMSVEELVPIAIQAINEISLEEVNTKFADMLSNRGDYLNILVSENANDVPSEADLMNIWVDYVNLEITQIEEKDLSNGFMEKPTAKAKINSKKELAEVGANEYVLENGVKIITKKTDFQNDYISIQAVSKGGSNYVSDVDYPSTMIATDYALLSGLNGLSYNDIAQISMAKNLMFNLAIGENYETILGETKLSETESMLQLFNLLFTKRQYTDDAWITLLNQYYIIGQNFGVNPFDEYNEKILKLVFGDDIRNTPLNLDFVSKMNQQTAETIVNDRFANAADFTFVVVGNFDETEVIDLCQYYLGTIPTTSDFEEEKFIDTSFPKGKLSEVVNRGIDQQGYAYLAFGGETANLHNTEANYKEEFILEKLISLLDIRLREVIREDNGGSYGVTVQYEMNDAENKDYSVSVQFGCEPERAEDLANQVIKTIEDIQTNGIADAYVQKIKETHKRDKEVNLRNNSWWTNYFVNTYIFEYYPTWVANDTETELSWITKENLQNAAKKFLNTKNYVSVFLKPEK